MTKGQQRGNRDARKQKRDDQGNCRRAKSPHRGGRLSLPAKRISWRHPTRCREPHVTGPHQRLAMGTVARQPAHYFGTRTTEPPLLSQGTAGPVIGVRFITV
jgi:hypothetical protein